MPGDNNDFQADKKDSGGEGQPVEQRLEIQIREDQVQNAVTFLSHPKVRSSPASSKRAFLQQKGLTAEEIAEAFKRVPEVPGLPASPSTAVVPSPSPSPSQQPTPQTQPPKSEPIRWSQIILSSGLFAASAYTVKSLVWPSVHDAWKSWRGSKNDEEMLAKKETRDGEGTNNQVATAVAEAIRAQTMELTSSIEALKELVCSLQQNSESASVEEKVTAAELRQELHSIAASLGEIAGPLARPPTTSLDISPRHVESELSEIKALLSEYLKTPRPEDDRSREVISPPARESLLAEAIDIDNQPPSNGNLDLDGGMKKESDHVPTSYMDVLAILERGETPPGIRTDINDKPPNPEQPPPPARLKARPKPWEKKLTAAEQVVELENDAATMSQDPLNSELAKPMPTQSIFEAATSPSRPSPSVIMERLASPTSQSPSLISKGTTVRRPLPIDVNFQNDSKTLEKGGDVIGSTQGSGLGRPSSRGWKPPPIPVPTLTLPAPDKSVDANGLDTPLE